MAQGGGRVKAKHTLKDWKITAGSSFRLVRNLATVVSFDYGIGGEEYSSYMELVHPFGLTEGGEPCQEAQLDRLGSGQAYQDQGAPGILPSHHEGVQGSRRDAGETREAEDSMNLDIRRAWTIRYRSCHQHLVGQLQDGGYHEDDA